MKNDIKFINDLAQVVDFLKNEGKKFILRGQTVDKPLLPQVARGNLLSVTDEIKIFEDFKRDAAQHLNSREEISSLDDDIERLTLGQHYKLKTRCLDWTMYTDVALFFAVYNPEDKNNDCQDGVIWAYDLTPYDPSEWLLPGDRFRNNPFQFQQIKIFHPKSFTDYRTDKQGALVTIHPYPWKSMEELKDDKRLIKMIVPAGCKQNIREELSERYVNRELLFSKENKAKELEDICMDINSKYSSENLLVGN